MALRRLTAIRDLAALLCTRNAVSSGCVRGYWSASQTRSGAQTSQQTSTDWAYWRAASAAAVGLACLLQDTESPAHCLTSPSDTEESVSEPLTADLQRWLASIGAETDAISIRDSKDHPSAGLGVFASDDICKPLHVSWWKLPWYRIYKPNDGIVLASFPLQAAITSQTILSDPVLGQTYQELLDIGVADERTLTLLFLTVERQLGSDSVWYPWIRLLPKKPETPLFYSDTEMAELRGTSLEEAVGLQKWHLVQQWKRLEPACKDLLRTAGAANQQATLEDFMWANAIFWSRSQSFPQPNEQAGEVVTIAQEGLVPGLDFCNHRHSSTAKWTIFGTPGLQASVIPTQMALVCPRQQAPRPGEEITISYGDKSNEQLLMSYGFTQTSNINDVLMVKCPIAPPEDRDEVLNARLELLQSRGLKPQLFLPATLIDVRPTRTGKDRHLRLPQDVEETLKILVMMPKQLAAELASEESVVPAQNTLDEVEESGERMAVLTTLVGLLQLKHTQMEDNEDGTGSLESDIQLMDADNDNEGDSTSDAKRACLRYRSSQKRIAREYWIRAREELDSELNRMRKLQEIR